MKVRDAIKLIKDDGWTEVRKRGSHRQYKHPGKAGLVTIPGKPGDDLAVGTFNEYFETGGVEVMKYLIVIEKTDAGYSAYSPDLPGCVSTGTTQEETERNMKDAIEFHIDGLRAEGYPVSAPATCSAYVEVAA
jgi:predicted RNA binding protein YcfA (HicA-like mRNA interferase family)/predicted RNase H-like HicB family nuclease